MSEVKTRVPLFSALLHEGLSLTLDQFMKLSKEEQVKIAEETIEMWTRIKEDMVMKTHSLQSKMFRDIFQSFVSEIEEAVQDMRKLVKENPLHVLWLSFLWPHYIMLHVANDIFATIFDMLMNWFMPTPNDTYEIALNRAKIFVTIVGDLNTIGAIFDALGKTKILGTKVGLDAMGRLVTNLGWTYGLGWLTWIVMGPIFRYGIADPITREMRRRVRDRDLTLSQIQELLRRGIEGLEQFKSRCVDLGYKDNDIERLIQLSYRLLALTDIRRLYEHGKISYEQFVNEISELGYHPSKLEEKLESELLSIRSSELRAYVSEVEDLFVSGYRSEDELLEAYDFAGYESLVKQLRLYRALHRKEDKINDLRVKEVEYAFREGKISEEEAVARLSEFIKDPQYIEALIALWKQRMKPEQLIDPLERARLRKKRLEVRIEGLNRQIALLRELLRERLETYDAMIEEAKLRIDSQLRRLEEVYDARVAVIREEFSRYVERTALEIEERVKTIELQLKEHLVKNRERFHKLVEKISIDTLSKAGYTRESLIEAYESGDIESLRAMVSQLYVYATREESFTLDDIMRIIIDYEELLARAELLKSIAEVRVEEREARLNELVERYRRELDARRNELMSRLEARLNTIRERKEDTEKSIQLRIERLQMKIDEYSVELAVLKKRIPQ